MLFGAPLGGAAMGGLLLPSQVLAAAEKTQRFDIEGQILAYDEERKTLSVKVLRIEDIFHRVLFRGVVSGAVPAEIKSGISTCGS